jgi:hypothetical protein
VDKLGVYEISELRFIKNCSNLPTPPKLPTSDAMRQTQGNCNRVEMLNLR